MGLESTSRPRLIIDCDPGHDDALALFVAAAHADVIGVSTVAGNSSLVHTTRNALVVTELAGLNVEVHAGASRPLLAAPRDAAHVHGATGLDGPNPRTPSRSAASNDAVRWLIETIRAQNGCWLVAVGPLTNVALALRQAPDIVTHLAGLSIMGGSTNTGNVTAVAEFNIWADPEAAAIVFDAPFAELRMCALNLTHQFLVDDEFIARLRSSDGAGATPSSGAIARGFCADLLQFYLDRYDERSATRAAPVHDVCAILAVTHPELFRFERRSVSIELHGQHTRGMTVVDERDKAAPSTGTDVAYEIDADAARELLFAAIAAGS